MNSLTADILSKSKLASKYEELIVKAKSEICQIGISRKEGKDRLEQVYRQCYQRKSMLEGIISKKYNNREVNIMGPFVKV